MGIEKAGDSVHYIDAVARELGFGHVDFGFDHRLHAEGEIGHGDLFLHAVVDAVDGAVVVAAEMEHGLAHGFGGDGAGVDAHAAHHLPGSTTATRLPILAAATAARWPAGPEPITTRSYATALMAFSPELDARNRFPVHSS